MLTKKQVAFLREELLTAKNPLFFYDGDPDGLASFILLYKINREGKGIILKASPRLDERSIRKVKELNPDKIFILDIPSITQEFVEAVNLPIFWLDHHEPQRLKGVNYYNPRIKNEEAYLPTTYMAWQISQNEEDLWIAVAGCLADWHLPDFIEKFSKNYPDYLKKNQSLEKAVYKNPAGKLVKLFSFMLKGPNSEIKKSIKILSRIKHPDEVFKQTTSPGKFLYKRFVKINALYEDILKEAKKKVTRSPLLLFMYTEQRWSFTADLANELVNLYPKKVVIIARKKSGKMKCSLRAKKTINEALARALQGIDGYGGGHPQACGAVINEEDWETFLKNFKEELK